MELYKIGPVSGKGLGVTASTHIPRGQQIMRQRPLIESPANVVLSSPSPEAANEYFLRKVEILSRDDQELFYTLSDWRNEQAGSPKTAYHIFRSNALPKGHGREAKGAAVYSTICRINHSCVPNCHYSWCDGDGTEVVHAVSDISPRQELGVTYIELFARRAERRAILQQKFGFQCTCPACDATGNTLMESDDRRARLAAIDKELLDFRETRPDRALAGLAEFVELFAAEGLADDYFLARAYRLAHRICEAQPHLGNAADFAELALESFAVSEGPEGDAAVELRQWLSEQRDEQPLLRS